jgi:hypothetical protein
MSQRYQRPRRALTTPLTAAVLTAFGASASPLGSPSPASAAQRPTAATQQPGRAGELDCPQVAPCGVVAVPLHRHDPDAGTTEVAYLAWIG